MKFIGRIVAWALLLLCALVCWAWAVTHDGFWMGGLSVKSFDLTVVVWQDCFYLVVRNDRVQDSVRFEPFVQTTPVPDLIPVIFSDQFMFDTRFDIPCYFGAPYWFILVTLIQWPMLHFGLAWWTKWKQRS